MWQANLSQLVVLCQQRQSTRRKGIAFPPQKDATPEQTNSRSPSQLQGCERAEPFEVGCERAYWLGMVVETSFE